jgi:tRNA 5-methylaminomethyl-2-thiouridine biosynthesis bifunctional protein
MHLIELFEGRILLLLALGESSSQTRLFDAVCDAFFLSGNMQTPPSALARLARKGSALALACAPPQRARDLTGSGFEIKQSPPQGNYTGSFRVQKRAPKTELAGAPFSQRSAIVIGAGLAGTAVAASLAKRGWSVSLLEREPIPAAGASGNLAAVFSPLLSLDDGRAARLSRACFLRLLHELRALDHAAFPAQWQACGVLQLPKSAAEETHFRSLVQHHAYPERYVRFLEKEAAETRFGHRLPSGGWYFEEGGWVNPPSLCAARILGNSNIRPVHGREVQTIRYDAGIWSAVGTNGDMIASAPVLVLANAWEASRLVPNLPIPFKRVRGQVAHLPAGWVPLVGPVLSKDGYLTPPVRGAHCLGATYDFGSEEHSLTAQAHAKNLDRLPQMLPEAPLPATHIPDGRVGFRSLTPDRMPIAGALSADVALGDAQSNGGELSPSGLYCLLGLGSRGLVWSALLGDYVASLIEGSPSPLALDLAAPLSPARFASRGSRGGSKL